MMKDILPKESFKVKMVKKKEIDKNWTKLRLVRWEVILELTNAKTKANGKQKMKLSLMRWN